MRSEALYVSRHGLAIDPGFVAQGQANFVALSRKPEALLFAVPPGDLFGKAAMILTGRNG